MVKLKHSSEPNQLTAFNQQYPNATPKDFDDFDPFKAIKPDIKKALHHDQGGLCVYCEKHLSATEGQIEHIKPKAAQQPTQPSFPSLAFTYQNFAHACINNKTCGQKKKSGILPIEPTTPNCNDHWVLLTNGRIEPLVELTKKQRQPVIQTRDMLGLNADAGLVKDREDWFQQIMDIYQKSPNLITPFLADSPFRHILTTVFR